MPWSSYFSNGNPLHNGLICLSMWEKLCQTKGQVWPLDTNHLHFSIFDDLIVVCDFVLAQDEDKSLRGITPCKIYTFEAFLVVDVMYQG